MEKQKEITQIFAANVSYSGMTFNTRLKVEFQHTGVYYFLKTKKGVHILSCKESADKKLSEGKKVFRSSGYYFMKRLAIPTITAKGENDYWYINNPGDSYTLNKASKYFRRIYQKLSSEETSKYIQD